MNTLFKTKLLFIDSKNLINHNFLYFYQKNNVEFIHIKSIQQDFFNEIKNSQIIYLVVDSNIDENIKIAQYVLKQIKALGILNITISFSDMNKTPKKLTTKTDLFLQLENNEIIKCINLINNSIDVPGLVNIDFKDIENMIKDPRVSKKGIFNFIKLLSMDEIEKIPENLFAKIFNKNFCIISINANSKIKISEIMSILNPINNKLNPNTVVVVSIFNDIVDEAVEISLLAF